MMTPHKIAAATKKMLLLQPASASSADRHFFAGRAAPKAAI